MSPSDTMYFCGRGVCRASWGFRVSLLVELQLTVSSCDIARMVNTLTPGLWRLVFLEMCPVRDVHMSWSISYCWIICKGREFTLISKPGGTSKCQHQQRALGCSYAWKGIETQVPREEGEWFLQPLRQARKVLVYAEAVSLWIKNLLGPNFHTAPRN